MKIGSSYREMDGLKKKPRPKQDRNNLFQFSALQLFSLQAFCGFN